MTDTRKMTLRNLVDYYNPDLPDNEIVTVPNGLLRELKEARPRDAAEGTGPNARLMPLLDLPPAEQFDIAFKLAENVGYVLAPDAYAATPQPAPDAMREALERMRESCARIAQPWPDSDPQSQTETDKAIIDVRKRIAETIRTEPLPALSTAPVPSPDGAGEPVGWVVRIKDVKCFYWERGVAEWKAGEFEDQRGVSATIDPVFLLPPSATEAAEPVATPQQVQEVCAQVADRAAQQDEEYAAKYPDEAHKFDQRAHRAKTIATSIRALIPPVATPPVSGDRTRVNSAADEVVQRVSEYSDRTSPDDFPEALLITPYELHNELTRFADDLFFPVQPGAGEREGIARLSASEVACYRWPEDSTEHRALRLAFMDGAAHTVTMWTPDIEGMVSGPYKYEKDLRTSFRVSIPGRDGRLVACVYATAGEDQAEADAELFARALRQAPQSSREG